MPDELSNQNLTQATHTVSDGRWCVDPSFQALVTAARNGDEQAATQLVHEYQPELRRYIRFRLTQPRLRRFLDSLDVCQSVLATFFVHLQGGRLDLVQPRQLFRLLAVMAENKLRDVVRGQRAVRRGGAANLSPLANTIDFCAAEQDPSEEVANSEVVTLLMDRIPIADRAAVERWLAGDGWGEIAATVGGSADAVRKRVARSVDRAAHELGLIEVPS